MIAVPNLNFDQKIKMEKQYLPALQKMGKKFCDEIIKRSANSHMNRKRRIAVDDELNNPSPAASRSSETAIYFDDQETPLSPAKSFQMRKAEALDMLNGSEDEGDFRHREEEIDEIESFVREVGKGARKGCRFLMVTGSPGLGKTVSVGRVIERNYCPVLAINANITRSLREVQQLIFQHLVGSKPARVLTTQKLARELISRNCTGPLLVYIQEIEVALRSTIDDYSCEFLTLFIRRDLQLGLLGVSNTINAFERYNSRVHFRLQNFRNLVFSPYGQETLACIIQQKLQWLSTRLDFNFSIEDRLLRYTTRKLESLTKGDIRMVNEFLKELVTNMLTAYEAHSESVGQAIFPYEVHVKVEIEDLNTVFEKIENSKQNLIQSLPFSQQLLLSGINFLISAEQLLYIEEARIFAGMAAVCEIVGVPVTKSKIRQWLGELESYCLIKIDERREQQARITLSINCKDIHNGCQQVNEKYLSYFLRRPSRNLL